MIFLTLALVNKFANFRIFNEEETIFLCLFLFVYIFFYLLILDKNKKALHNKFIFNNNGPQIERIKKNTEKKIKQSARSPQITQQRSLKFFGIFWYKKGAHLTRYQNKRGIKYMGKTQGCVLPNTPLVKSSLGRMGWDPDQTRSLLFYWAGSSPAWSLAQSNDPTGQQTRVN